MHLVLLILGCASRVSDLASPANTATAQDTRESAPSVATVSRGTNVLPILAGAAEEGVEEEDFGPWPVNAGILPPTSHRGSAPEGAGAETGANTFLEENIGDGEARNRTTSSTTTTRTTVTSTTTGVKDYGVTMAGWGVCVGTSFEVPYITNSSGGISCPSLENYFSIDAIHAHQVSWWFLKAKSQCIAVLRSSSVRVKTFPLKYRQNFNRSNNACTAMCNDHSDVCAAIM